jgi:hypothetical protein
MFISDRSYRNGVNVMNRGGVVRTRPGYNTIFTLPDGKLQGLWYYRPLESEAYLIFAVAGKVYSSQYPFRDFSQLANLSFFPYAVDLYAECGVQAARTKSDGTVEAIAPKRVIVFQDGGYTRAGYWDGAMSGHLDPSDAAMLEATLDTTAGTPIDGLPTYGVGSVAVASRGNGYTVAPRVVFDAPDLEGGVTAEGTAILSGDEVESVVVTNSGSGYLNIPNVYVTDPSLSSADPLFGVSNKFQTPMGGPMVWSGDRLWVMTGSKVFASDISNPLSFIENEYAAEGGFFQLTEPGTALAEVPHPTNPFVAAFTDTSTTGLQSSIRARSTWKLTPGFQSTIFPGVGCVSHRSVVKPLGELWWMSPFGLISFNAAAQASTNSKLIPQDTKMMISKSNLSPDLARVCAGTYENIILTSVPNSDKYNRHTWVYDQATQSDDATAGSLPSWAGYWTGTRPVQWATGMFSGVQRAFYVSKDFDGKNRLWEAFVSAREDNGLPIECFVETKLHTDFLLPQVTGLDNKKFVYGEATFSDIKGQTLVDVSWAGVRGKYKNIGNRTLEATRGSLVAGVDFTSVSTYLGQSRVVRTQETNQKPITGCSSLGIESELGDYVDTGFSLLIKWTGQAALRNYRIYADPIDQMSTGKKDEVEENPRILVGTTC